MALKCKLGFPGPGLWGPPWAIAGHRRPSLIRDTTAHLPDPSSRTRGRVGTWSQSLHLAGLSLKACRPPPSHSVAVLLLCQVWLSPVVQSQSLEDSENRGQLGARLFLSRFHHCLSKIKKMRVLPRAKRLSLSEAPSIVKTSTSD
ncbi:unnamed protein product [Rangifer tarandus platyrhynchus]|uniref:Uncharacterized protein n=2 Tax=Rangifer tarandus platyrhynchus TaxID=3082113 RepID=A0AC59YWC8_RANTA|nr:unnamed protein product [Rangifer tarandus platyrhynchus]